MSKDNNKLLLYAVGDIMLGDHSYYLRIGIGSRLRTGRLADPFEHVKHLLRKGDIVLGNLETVLSKRTNCHGFNKIDLRGEPSWAKLIAEAGFNVISVANNHAMHHGIGAWYESIRNLRNAGINVVGVKKDPTLILKCKGIRIAILGFSLRPPQYGVLSPPYSLASAEEVRERVSQAKENADIVILSLHWGDEYCSRPSQEQLQIGESFIRSGATLIVGHHPHVLQGIERKGRAAIAYSLGNFVSDMTAKRSRESAILSLDLSKQGIEGLSIIPILIGEDYSPYLLDSGEGELVMGLIKKYNAGLGLSKNTNAQTEYPKEVKKTIKEFQNAFIKWLMYNWRRYPPLALFWIISGIVIRKLLLPAKWLINR
jgi:poly-gamma-glutamate synthesis protein (capsule biosynthesis protein)